MPQVCETFRVLIKVFIVNFDCSLVYSKHNA